MRRVSPSDLESARRAAPYVAAAGSIAIVLANWSSSYCDVYLASQFFECEPVGVIDDLGHALIPLATVPLALTLSHPFLSRLTRWVTRFGIAVMVALAGLHLLLAIGILDHTSTVPALRSAWALFGLWLIAERGFHPTIAAFAGGLGVTMIVWSLAFGGGIANDAVRVAGGGIFVIGYPFWLAYATWRKRRKLGPGPRPLVQALRLIAAALATLVLGLPSLLVWTLATFGGPIMGDPAFFLTITNATDVPVLLPGIAPGGLAPGATREVSWGSHGRFVATTVDGTPVYCRDISTYDRLRQKARVTITRDPGSC
jgi:hypothetical protein